VTRFPNQLPHPLPALVRHVHYAPFSQLLSRSAAFSASRWDRNRSARPQGRCATVGCALLLAVADEVIVDEIDARGIRLLRDYAVQFADQLLRRF
jgi:hypothetical protein